MDPSGGELQELRKLLGELTARVFRIEQALNMRSVVAAEAPPPPQVAPPPPPAMLKSSAPVISAAVPVVPPGSARPGIPHRFALAEPDRHHRRADRGFLLPEICLRQQLDWTGWPGCYRIAGRYRHRGLEREFPAPRICHLFLLAESRRHRRALSLAVRRVPGVQPGAGRRRLQHDVRGDRRHGGDGLDPGRGNPRGICPDRRLQYTDAALHRPEP